MNATNEHIDFPEPAPSVASAESERDIVRQLLKPNEDCLLCGATNTAFAVNRDWLDGRPFDELTRAHQDEYRQVSGGNPLTPTTLAIHFNKHVGAKGAAINKWTRGLAARFKPREEPAAETHPDLLQELQDASLGTDKLHLAELAAREIIANLEAIKKDIAVRRAEGRTFDLSIVMKEYGKLLQGLHAGLLKAAEVDSKLDLNASSIHSARVLDFALLRSTRLVGSDGGNYDEFVLSAERLWFAVAVKHIVARLDEALKSVRGITHPMRAEALSHIKSAMAGLGATVSAEYESELRQMQAERKREAGSLTAGAAEPVDGVAEPVDGVAEPVDGAAGPVVESKDGEADEQ